MKYDLTYASCYAPKISTVIETEGAKEIIKDIILCIIEELAEFLTSKEIEENKIRDFVDVLINQFRFNLTISSIAHWAYLIQCSAPPFDVELFGFDRRKLLGSMNKYIAEQKKWKANREQTAKNKAATSLPMQQNLLANIMRNNPEIKKKIVAARKMLEVRYPSIHELRRRNTLLANKIIEI